MPLACKYVEVFVPLVEDFVFIEKNDAQLPTAYVFMRRYLKAAQSDRKLELLSFFVVELCLEEYEMFKFPTSFIVAAAIYTAQTTLYDLLGRSIIECSRSIVNCHQKAATGN
ncbi:cyclin-b2-4 [Nicotiana attenuata]|uniref:Cyclin-b2-4 n=1 Tax=Nicotiana attenuata TaxID=49451 RepID=A0A1J6IIE7_NICAT|nr:cyclin-b2-4 [Nicotiana attenuata]